MSSALDSKPQQYEAFDDLEDEERIYLDESGLSNKQSKLIEESGSLKPTVEAKDDPVI